MPTANWAYQFDPGMPSQSKRIIDQFHAVMENSARNAYVNCWHMNEDQSIAMWIYGHGEHGIALRSDFTRLCAALHNTKREIRIGVVTYGSDEPEFQGSTPQLVLQKKRWWDWERELRAVTHVRPEEWSDDEMIRYGIPVRVDLNVLIQSVYVAPTAPLWFVKLVQALMRRYELVQPVVPSELLRSPVR